MSKNLTHYYPRFDVEDFIKNSKQILKTEKRMISIYEAIFFNNNNLGREIKEIPQLNLKEDISFFEAFATFPKDKKKFKEDILHLISLPKQEYLYSESTRREFELLMDMDNLLLSMESKLNVNSPEELYFGIKDYVVSHLGGISK